jgi:phage-related protein
MIEEFGSDLGKPYTSKVEKELFEIRAKGKEGIGRSFFCTTKGRKVIILHSFIKKTQKIPKKELEIARKRLKEYKNEYNKV